MGAHPLAGHIDDRAEGTRKRCPRLGLREVPVLRFLLDDSIENGARVEALLKKIERGESVQETEQAQAAEEAEEKEEN